LVPGYNALPNGKSILEITSTTKEILFPRRRKTQRDAIALSKILDRHKFPAKRFQR